MLGADAFLVEVSGILLGQLSNPAGTVGKSLVHGAFPTAGVLAHVANQRRLRAGVIICYPPTYYIAGWRKCHLIRPIEWIAWLDLYLPMPAIELATGN